MKITWFGHSAFRLDFDGHAVMIDPFLSGSPVFDGEMAEAARGATHVLLTHGHDDHLGDAAAICRDTGATLVANFEICMFLSGRGVENYSPGNSGGTVDAGGFTVSFTQALHSSSSQVGPGKGAVYLGSPNGLVVRGGGHSVYHMGDTDIFGDMALVNELYAPDIGIVPIGDRFTMGAKSAALACRRFFGFEIVFPCHYGTFPIIDATADAFVAEMAGRRVEVPKVGGSVEV
jgi:L-ascorbate metabolism protein UlaG (beta-lactamase superfamily)